MIRRPPRSTLSSSSAASDVYKRQYMDSPGYDPCSVTGQIASGANIIVFTTGRGSVSGYKPSPCIKLSTNTGMYRRMSGDID